MKIQAPKRIMTSDFEDDDKAVAGKMASLLNTFLEEMYSLSNKNVTIGDNLDQSVKTISLQVNSSGIPTTSISFQNPLKGKIQGCQVIRVFGNSYPTAQPFVSFTERNGVIEVNHVSGLPANTNFQLVILLIGQ